MATTTPNYGLRKPATTDLVDVTADLDNNWDTIDTQMKTIDNARVSGDSGLDTRVTTLEGAPTTIKNDRLQVVKSAVQSIAASTETDVIWQTKNYDPNVLIAVPFSTFTVPAGKTGLWAITAAVQWQEPAAATDIRSLDILVNGLVRASSVISGSVSTSNHASNMGASWVGYLAAADTVRIQVFQNGAAAINVEAWDTATRATVLTIQRLQ